jgi:hypothetical protein
MTATAANPLGRLALIDDVKRAAALALVREGRMYDLGQVLDERVPVFPGRYFKQTLVTTAHHANPAGGVGDNDVNCITELVSGTMQLGTYLDALSHLQMADRGYGRFTVGDLADVHGVRHLGVEIVLQIATQGWLVDVSGLGAGRTRRATRTAPASTRRPAMRSCSTPDGGATGRTRRRTCRASRAPAASSLLGWRSDRSRSRAAIRGAAGRSGGRSRPAVPRPADPQHRLRRLHRRNLDLAALAADRVRRFALILTHPKLRGATGAWCSPIALV